MPVKPSKNNRISDLTGLLVGCAHDTEKGSGVTVVEPPKPNICVASVRGGSPGTRETDVLRTYGAASSVDAIVLSGGSVFGLEAAGAITQSLANKNKGLKLRKSYLPIVPAAVFFDLFGPGAGKEFIGSTYHRLGNLALDNASEAFRLGNSGAGYGAKAGLLKSGLGTSTYINEDGIFVGALTVANPIGNVLVPGTSTLWGWPFEQDAEFGGRKLKNPCSVPPTSISTPAGRRVSTVIAVVATNVIMDKQQIESVANMAHDGIARCVVPSHLPEDGDTIFALSSMAIETDLSPRRVGMIGALAADCVARSICRGIYEAETIGNLMSLRDLWASEDR